MTEEKRKRLTTVETVEAVLNTTKEFIGQRIDNLKEDIDKDVQRLENKIEAHGEIIREHDQQIASLCTIVKNGKNNCERRWRPQPKTLAIGGGTATIIACIILAILEVLGKL